MPYLPVQQPVDVAGVYKQGKFFPTAFQWRQEKWPIVETTFIADIRDGGLKQRHFSVISRNTLCRLIFHRDLEHWILEEVWDEPVSPTGVIKAA